MSLISDSDEAQVLSPARRRRQDTLQGARGEIRTRLAKWNSSSHDGKSSHYSYCRGSNSRRLARGISGLWKGCYHMFEFVICISHFPCSLCFPSRYSSIIFITAEYVYLMLLFHVFLVVSLTFLFLLSTSAFSHLLPLSSNLLLMLHPILPFHSFFLFFLSSASSSFLSLHTFIPLSSALSLFPLSSPFLSLPLFLVISFSFSFLIFFSFLPSVSSSLPSPLSSSALPPLS